jgi:hypothetical protein
MSTWKEEVWGKTEIMSECNNPKCGEEDESEDDESEN